MSLTEPCVIHAPVPCVDAFIFSFVFYFIFFVEERGAGQHGCAVGSPADLPSSRLRRLPRRTRARRDVTIHLPQRRRVGAQGRKIGGEIFARSVKRRKTRTCSRSGSDVSRRLLFIFARRVALTGEAVWCVATIEQRFVLMSDISRVK